MFSKHLRRGLGEGGAIVTCCSQPGCNWNRETATGNLDINRLTLRQSRRSHGKSFTISADSSVSLAGIGAGVSGSWPWVVLVCMLLVLALLILVVYFRSKLVTFFQTIIHTKDPDDERFYKNQLLTMKQFSVSNS